jgi:hypothetical protein
MEKIMWRLRALVPSLAIVSWLAAALCAWGALAASPSFNDYSGSWSGGGTITLEGGQKEKVRCSGTASGSDSSISQSVRCASTSYRFNISSSLRLSGASVSGSVSESQSGFTGSVFGKASGTGFRGTLTGNSVSASGTVSGGPRSQSISMTLGSGKVRRVSISLKRR